MILKSVNKKGVAVFKLSPKLIDERLAKQSEAGAAKSFYAWAIHEYPELEGLLFHVVNEGRRSFNNGADLKEMGLIKGVADYIVLKPSGEHPYAVIEMKKTKGGTTSAEQNEFLISCHDAGGFACIAHGSDAAKYALKLYMGNKTV